MKAILISIKPQHLVHILNGKKTIEIRKNKALANAIKNLIQEYGYATIYVYCSKDKNELVKFNNNVRAAGLCGFKTPNFRKENHELVKWIGNGKVVCSFRCYKVEEISFDDKEVQRKACLTEDELFDYLFVNEPYHEDMKKGYAIHISDLKIFDAPKELGEFKGNTWNSYNCDYGKPCLYKGKCQETQYMCCSCYKLTKAPQNFCYVEIPNDN